jgi:hypothetical protein
MDEFSFDEQRGLMRFWAAFGLMVCLGIEAPSASALGPGQEAQLLSLESQALNAESHGRKDEAISAYTKAIALDPNRLESLFGRGLLTKDRAPERARRDFETIVSAATKASASADKSANTTIRNFYYRAKAYEQLGNCTAAKSDATTVCSFSGSTNRYCTEARQIATRCR